MARIPKDDEGANVVVPVSAVFADMEQQKSFVWVIDENADTVAQREVQLGNLVSGGYVIDAGLEPGEVIATAGVHFLTEGQQVRPEYQ